MKKGNQNPPVDATTPAFPEHVSVAMAEIAENMGEGLLALAVGAGLQVMQTLRDRGLDVTRPMLVGIDRSKALRKAVVDVLDHPVIQRHKLHKVSNVKDSLPKRLRAIVGRRMTDAYHTGPALEAEAALLALAAELDRTHPAAAASLRERLYKTPTVLRLGVPPTLARTLRSTNAIESMISICSEHAENVKRWRDGKMALRWCAAGMVEAGKQFRRVKRPPAPADTTGCTPT